MRRDPRTAPRIAAVLAIAAAAALCPAVAQATFPGDNGLIVFERSYRSGEPSRLHSILPDGNQLTTLPIQTRPEFPSFSSSGERFVYVCGNTLCTARPDGSDQARFEDPSLPRSRWPGFSPDNRRLVFSRGAGELMIARSDGAEAQRLKAAGQAWQPEFTPDGKRIVFSRKVDHGREIYSIKVNGHDLERLSHAPKGVKDINPSVSPDGRRILFERGDPDSVAIWSMRADGSGAKRLIRDAGTPEWSPDGRLIAHQKLDSRLRNSGLAVSKANGTGTRLLTPIGRPYFDNRPTWQPLR